MRGVCQVCARRTNQGFDRCYIHRHPDSVRRSTISYWRNHDTRKFDPEPIKHWIATTGPIATVCRNAGIPRRFFYRANRLQWHTVDRYCVALGVHPVCIYGKEWWAA